MPVLEWLQGLMFGPKVGFNFGLSHDVVGTNVYNGGVVEAGPPSI